VIQERRYLGFAHLPWMALAVKDDASPNPLNVSHRSLKAVMPAAQHLPHLVEETLRSRRGLVERIRRTWSKVRVCGILFGIDRGFTKSYVFRTHMAPTP